MDEIKLQQIINSHDLWLKDNSEGMRADLSGIDLSEADLGEADLHGADLRRANLYGANLSRANLGKANLYEANLSGADLRRTNLSGADLSKANLGKANLYEANLRGSDLHGADLHGANLRGADLSGAIGIICIESQYIYQSYGYYFQESLRVRLGCYDRTVEEWDANFWNNTDEFPAKSPKGQNRRMVYEFIKTWLLANKEQHNSK